MGCRILGCGSQRLLTNAALEELLVPLLLLELPRAVQAVLLQVPVASSIEVMCIDG